MRYLLLLALLAGGAPAPAFAQSLIAYAGGGYSEGRYGGPSRLEIGSAYVGLAAQRSGWLVDATLTYFTIAGPSPQLPIGIVGPGGGAAQPLQTRRTPVPGAGAPLNPSGRLSGLGDLTVRVGRPLRFAENQPVELMLSTLVKIPTGRTGISTGKLDAGVELEGSVPVGSFAPYVSLGYWVYGDRDDLPLRDGWSGSAGALLSLGPTRIAASYEWAQSPLRRGTAHELAGLATGWVSERWGWMAYGRKGLGEPAADFQLGAGIIRNFGPPSRAQPGE